VEADLATAIGPKRAVRKRENRKYRRA